MTNIRVVPATPEALAKIKAWLEVEDTVHRETLDAQEAHWDPKVELPTKGFLCNWNLVEKTFETDPGAVQVLLEGDEPVGFIDGLDIMEVRPDLRGRGYGRRLAEFMLDWATRRGYSVAQIEIAPDDAIPFWRRMGFTVANASRSGPSGGVPAYKILDHRFELGEGPRIPYSVAFYSQARDYDPTVKPFVVFQGEGERLEDGSVQLPQRAFSFREADPEPEDVVVAIRLNGLELIEDKVKRSEMRLLGMHRDEGWVYAIDRIVPPSNGLRDRPSTAAEDGEVEFGEGLVGGGD